MNNFQSPESLPKKVVSFQTSSQQQKSTIQKLQETGNSDIYHLTASFGMAEAAQQGGFRSHFKNQQEGLYYKSSQEKNQDYPRQLNDFQMSGGVQQDELNQREIVYVEDYHQEESPKANYSQGVGQQDQNELHYRSQEYNEDTLHQQQFQSVNSNEQSQRQSLQNWNKKKPINNNGNQSSQRQKSNDSKIQMYLQQMVNTSNNMVNQDEYIQNYMSLPSAYSAGGGGSLYQYHSQNAEEQDVQRHAPPPAPESIGSQRITFSEIAHLKQKQRQASKDKLKESKQKKLLDEIAHFYRQLAANKKGEDNCRSSMTSPSPLRKSESNSQILKKTPQNKSIERRGQQTSQQSQKQQLQQSKSQSTFTKRENEVAEGVVEGGALDNLSTVKENMRYMRNSNSQQSVSQFSVNKSMNENQENIQSINSESSNLRQPHQKLQIKTEGDESKESKRQISHPAPIKSSSNKSIQLQNKPKHNNNSIKPTLYTNIPIDAGNLNNFSLVQIVNFSPIQLQQFENQIKKSSMDSLKSEMLNKYAYLTANSKYSEDKKQFLSTLQELMESNGVFINNINLNLAGQLQMINKISKRNLLAVIKELVEQIENFETLTQDIQAISTQRESKKNLRTTHQMQKDEQTVALLKDMQMRLAQKIFFTYLWRVQFGYKKEITKQLKDFETAKERLRLSISFSILKRYSTIRGVKGYFLKVTKNEIQLKRLKSMFDAIKAKGNKNIYYKPFVIAIRDNHRRILKQSSLIALFENSKRKKNQIKKLNLSKQICEAHLLTKSFLILKAFSNRKKSHASVQTMTAKNITLQFTAQMRSLLNIDEVREGQYFSSRFYQSSQGEPEQQQYSTLTHGQHYENINNEYEDQKEQYEDTTKFSTQNNRDKQPQTILSRYSQSQKVNKFNGVQRHLTFHDQEGYDRDDCTDQSYDSKQFQKHFYCEEEFLTSARNLLDAKRQITLDKLDRLKNYNADIQDEQSSSFLQKNKEKVQEQLREHQLEMSVEQSSNKKDFEFQSDSKINMIQVATIDQMNTNAYQQHHNRQENVLYDQEFMHSAMKEKDSSETIRILEQHIKSIIKVLKKLSKKKESFKHKSPADLLLKNDAFYSSNSGKQELSSARSNNRRRQIHPLQEHQDMIKRIEQNEKKQVSSYLFYHWKVVFLERTLAAEITLLSSLKKTKKVLNAFKQKYRENNEICTLKQQIREEKLKSNVFDEWFSMAHEKSLQNAEKINDFHTKICFRRMLYFSAYSKIKRVADNFYLKNMKNKVLKQWNNISRENADIRKRHKSSLIKRFFRQWEKNTQRTVFLKRFWKKILYTTDEILFEKYGNKKNLLRAMLQSWRGIVIDNEHSMKQKLALKSAIQHRSVVQKTKAFFQWIRFIQTRRGLLKLLQSKMIKKILSRKLLLPWKEAVANQKSAVIIFRRKMNMNTQFKAFHSLKIKYLQNKIAKNSFIRKFFAYWKCQKEYRQEILPRNYYNRKLIKKCMTSVIYNQLLQMRERAKIEKSTKFFLYHIKSFMQTCLTLWQKQTHKRKSKKLLKIKLQRYAEKNIKKRAFNSFKLFRVLQRLKVIQHKKALEFRAVQYQKRYNLKRLTTDPHLNPQLQVVLSILHYWKAFAVKNKNIKFIQSRIFKFHDRKTINTCFMKWQSLFNERVAQKERAELEDTIFNSQNSAQNIKPKMEIKPIDLNQDLRNRYTHKKSLSNQSKQEQQDQSVSFSQNQNFHGDLNQANQKNEQLQKERQPKAQIESRMQPSYSNQSLPITEQQHTYRTSSRSPRFQSIQSRNSKSPSSRSNSPNYNNKSTLKTSTSQENIRKSRKSVRFEMDPKEQYFSQDLPIHRLDYFDQKYNENEAFYQKILSQKRQNTSQS